ncbi:MAG: hypothetical protein JOY66_04910 [Acetobacteraceae bacterium]|nr:hypothetical protein [Acetobacteraceae bacterium]
MSSLTVHYTAPGGSVPYGDTVEIQGDTLLAGPGSFEVSATGAWVLSGATDNIAFDPGSSFDGVIMSQGGNVSLNGNWNFVTGSGAIAVDEAGAGDRHNAFDVTTGVTALAVNDTKPTDTFRMHGFTQADISAGLAGAQRLAPTAEFVTFSHAASGGSPARSLGVLLTGAFPTAAQFNAV